MCKDTGPLTRKRMETVEEELLIRSQDFMDRSVKAGKPFFLWHNPTRMHVWTHLSPKWQGKSGYGLYADGMMELDYIVGTLLKKLDDFGIADNTIVVFTSDNGAEVVSWPDGGNVPFCRPALKCLSIRFAIRVQHPAFRRIAEMLQISAAPGSSVCCLPPCICSGETGHETNAVCHWERREFVKSVAALPGQH